MKLKRINTIIGVVLLAAASLIMGCEDNELDVNADWKETMVIYGLLDINSDTQYIRVQKAYLNPNQDALEVAQIADSLYFDDLEVLLIDLKTQNKIELSRTTDIAKDSGIFANTPNILYFTDEEIFPDRKYKLQITNRESGNVVTAETNIVYDASSFSPIKGSTGNFNLPPDNSIPYGFKSGVNGRIYDFIIRFYYDEISLDDKDTVEKTVDWVIFKNRRLSSSSQSLSISTILDGEVFLDYLSTSIPTDSNVYREMKFCDLNYYGGADELDVYLSVNRPSLGIVQKKPEYTNINNGLGLFSSRNITRIEGVVVNPQTKYYLANRIEVAHLNFRD